MSSEGASAIATDRQSVVPGSEITQADLAARVLKRLSATLQDARLYTVQHPFTSQAIDLFLPLSQTYFDAHGTLTVELARTSFTLDFETSPRRDDLTTPLVYALYARQVRRVSLLDGLVAEEVRYLMEALLTPRSAVRRLGGIGQMLWKRGVQHIALHEMIVLDEGLPIIEDEVLEAVLARQNVLPENREELRNLLLRPEQARQFFEAIVRRVESREPTAPPEAVFDALGAVDLIIAGALPTSRAAMYENLAWTMARAAPPLGPRLRALTVARSGEHALAAEMLRVMDDDVLRGALAEALALGSPERGVAQSLALALRPDVMRVRRLLESTPPLMRVESVREAVEMATLETATWPVRESVPPAATDGGLELSDASVRAAAMNDLVRLLRVVDAGDVHSLMLAIERESSLLLRDGHLQPLSQTVRELKHVAIDRSDAADVPAWLNGLVVRELTIRLLDWMAQHQGDEDWAWAYFHALRDELIPILVDLLEQEDRISIRRMVVAVLTRIGAERSSLLLAKLSDPKWYVVRNITGILGEIRNPVTLRHLRRSLFHPELRVRREAMRVLADWGTDDAVLVLVEALDDADPETRRAAAGWLGASGRSVAAQALAARLQRRDLLLRDADFQKAVIRALGQIGDPSAVPLLRRIARSPLAAVSRRHRSLAAVARQALTTLSARAASPRS